MGWRASVGATVTTVVVLFGGYLVADAYDVVPGMLTTAPPPAPAAPFPTAPGATAGPTPERSLPDLPSDAPEPAASAVGKLVTGLAKDDRLGKRVGALVVDGATGETLGSAAPDRPMVPASTQKLFTAVAALAGPGGDTTLPTTAVLDGDAHVVLVGGGDMMLAAGGGDPDAVNGRAGLGDLADQVAGQVGLTGATVTLSVDDTLFAGPAVPADVPAADVKDGYTAPVAALAVDVARTTDEEYAPREKDPAMAAARTFAKALEERGVTVRGEVSRATAPSSAREVARVESAPLRDVVGDLLRRSDNTITEVVGRIVAIDAGLPGTGEDAIRAVTAQVEDLGVDMDGATLVDLSGLGRGSKATPRQLGDLLTLAVDPDHPELRDVADGLAVAGLNGTLHDRYPKPNPGRGYVNGKTGSLPKVTGLAGTVVTADDRLLVFVTIADKVPDGGGYGARVIFDNFAGRLADCGCRPAG
ncbi:D-alanyl-D-alanine carboxypeptidase/D-alanyl-D-alanine endopeptidase [Krasilnikoviella flava]|uniref:D-alanyl-D-alanine carboxypeptidase / D-alanyl-D-alanine-endopeptidase (Penicillin-binding protein 4) n=1 Tax=Krasilnikoviella flava TaxID=526729 RepID=A0A1T5IL21_9MICO|nr:D-alanyl-D-alanine carboxypeptidase/D-alanyl-D-alanine-endopeptidase [Krasilnikoviella flava]SKC39819.1 D-alanyl-D-alanine carboxypeptidase / D-alanyl-D-alanine-endopeptidase (penicillin-binding protein 4) [Krasilnikoviella flava]